MLDHLNGVWLGAMPAVKSGRTASETSLTAAHRSSETQSAAALGITHWIEKYGFNVTQRCPSLQSQHVTANHDSESSAHLAKTDQRPVQIGTGMQCSLAL